MTLILSETLRRPSPRRRGAGARQERFEDFQLLFDQEADRAPRRRKLLGDGDHRRLIAMAGAEGVVDVAIGQGGHLPGEGQVTLLLAAVKPYVLEQDDAAREQRMAGGLSFWTDGIVDLEDRPADELREAICHFVQPERPVGDRVALGAAQVTDQDQASATIQDILGVGSALWMRRSSATLPSGACGTLKSTRTKTFRPETSRSLTVRLAMRGCPPKKRAFEVRASPVF